MNILLLTHSYPDKNQKWRGVFVKEQVKALSLEHNGEILSAEIPGFYSGLDAFVLASRDETFGVDIKTIKKNNYNNNEYE